MSRDIRQYWQEIRKLESSLPEFVWLASTAAGAPPVVAEASALIAAKLLQAKSHRRATKEEVEAHRTNEADTIKQAHVESKRRSGAAVVVVEQPAKREPANTRNPAVTDLVTSEPSQRRRR